MPRLSPEDARWEAQETARETAGALKHHHRAERWVLLAMALAAAGVGVWNWSAAWGASAVTILAVLAVLDALQRTQAALSFGMAMRENDHGRVMDDLITLTRQVGSLSAELHSLRSSLTPAGVIPDREGSP